MELKKNSIGAQASSPAFGASKRSNRHRSAPLRFPFSNHGRTLKLVTRVAATSVALVLISFAALFIHSYRSYAKIVDARLEHGYLKSRAGIYAAPRVLRPGQKYSPVELAAALRRAGYIDGDDAGEIWNGSFSVRDEAIEIRPSSDERLPAVVRVTFDRAGRISEITGDGATLDTFMLAPESLTTDPLTRGGTRTQLSFKDIPPVLVHAITSIEDHRFFDHHGLDLFGVARAIVRNAGEERIGQGGSTITQQLVKNTYLTSERTFRRKFAEAMLAFTIERRLTKEDIFALYCNEIFLGQRGAIAVRGVDQAARIYFGKQLKDLSLSEAATIAGMIQSPARYSPVRQNEAARARRNTVLGTMVRDGFITLDQAAATSNEPLLVKDFDPATESVAPYFIDYVNRLAAGGTGISPVNQGQDAQAVVTTLDLDLQRVAAEAVRRQLVQLDRIYKPRGVTPQAALVALDPRTGAVLAMVGGRDYAESQMNRAVDAQRQPGSVFKPFVYAAALESGMSPLAVFKDAPQEFTYAGNRKYQPANFGGGFSMRDVTMRTGLIKSLNVVTVDVAIHTGLARVANTALKFGLPRPTPFPALALGTTEVTPVQIAAAYATFANGGQKIQPQVIAGAVPAQSEPVIAPTTAFMITDMLSGVIDQGTARGAREILKITAAAGKTGTSRDGWFVGYTPNLVCAVWIGFDDNQQLGLTGAEAALPVWTEFIKQAIDLRPELGGKSFAQPEGITIADVDPESGGLATSQCPSREHVALLTTEAPTSECFRHNIYFDLGNDSNQSMVKSEIPRSNRKPTKNSAIELAKRETRIDRDNRGRSVLVNEMRIAGR